MKCESRKCSPKLEELNRLKAKFWWVPLAAKMESTDNRNGNHHNHPNPLLEADTVATTHI